MSHSLPAVLFTAELYHEYDGDNYDGCATENDEIPVPSEIAATSAARIPTAPVPETDSNRFFCRLVFSMFLVLSYKNRYTGIKQEDVLRLVYPKLK